MHSEWFRSRKKVTMNSDQAHSYLIIVLIRLECFAVPEKGCQCGGGVESVFGKPSVEGGSKLSADRSNEQASRRTKRSPR